MQQNNLGISLPVLAATVAKRYDIRIHSRGNQAYTDGNEIVIPLLDPADSNAIALAVGYIYHEAAGHCRRTDFDRTVTWRKLGQPQLKSNIQNIFEDVWIEDQAAEEVPGVYWRFNNLVKAVVEADDENLFNHFESKSDANIILGYVLCRGRYVGNEYPAAQLGMDAWELQLDKAMPGLKALIDPIIDRAKDCKSTQDAIDLTEEIWAVLESADLNEQQESGDSDGSDSSKGDEDSDDDSDGSDSSKGDEGSDDDSEGSDSSKGDEESDDDSEGSDSSKGDEDSDGKPSPDQVLKDAMESDDVEPTDMGDIVKAEIDTASQEAHEAGTEGSGWAGLEFSPQLGDAEKMEDVERVASTLCTRLVSLVQSQTLEYKGPLRNSGKRISRKNMCRYQIDPNVFERKVVVENPNTAVHLLLDISGSMCSIIGEAQLATLASSVALGMLEGVSVAATAFPWECDGYRNYVIQERTERPVDIAGRISRLQANGSTPLTEAITPAVHELFAAVEPRKMMIIITDGEPDNAGSAIEMIRKAQHAGIEVMAITICSPSNSLARALEMTSNINTVSELPTVMTDLFRSALRNYQQAA